MRTDDIRTLGYLTYLDFLPPAERAQQLAGRNPDAVCGVWVGPSVVGGPCQRLVGHDGGVHDGVEPGHLVPAPSCEARRAPAGPIQPELSHGSAPRVSLRMWCSGTSRPA
jgi:hypothetical protein